MPVLISDPLEDPWAASGEAQAWVGRVISHIYADDVFMNDDLGTVAKKGEGR